MRRNAPALKWEKLIIRFRKISSGSEIHAARQQESALGLDRLAMLLRAFRISIR